MSSALCIRSASGPTLDSRPEKIGAKIRDAQLEKIPVMLVVGAKEVETGTVSYRDRIDGDRGALPLAEVVRLLRSEIDSKAIRQVAAAYTPPEADPNEEHHTY